KFGALPPSNLTLTNAIAENPDPVSKQFLLGCWPRLQPTVNWGGMAGTLSGDQVLVWALGGMQTGPSGTGVCLGFSDHPRHPTQPGGQRIRPFYEFRSNRLIQVAGGRNSAFSYDDVRKHGCPYLYFAAKPGGNQYTADCMAVPGHGARVEPYFDQADPIHF